VPQPPQKALDRLDVQYITPEQCSRPLTRRILLSMVTQVLPASQVNDKVLGELSTALQTGALRAYWIIAPSGQKAGMFAAQLSQAGAEKLFYINATVMANNVQPEAWCEAVERYLKPHAKSLGCTHIQFDSTPGNKAIEAIANNLGATLSHRYTVEV